MNREVHVRVWERAEVKFLRATRQHRLFSFITINWRGKPLRSYRTIVQLIAGTTTDTGLKVRAELDENKISQRDKGYRQSLSPLIPRRLELHGFTKPKNSSRKAN